jgi:hypothetical protein
LFLANATRGLTVRTTLSPHPVANVRIRPVFAVQRFLFKRASGFERKVEKATTSGKKVSSPMWRLSASGYRTECQRYTKEKVQKHTMSSDEWEERQELQLVDRANALDVKPEPKSKLA